MAFNTIMQDYLVMPKSGTCNSGLKGGGETGSRYVVSNQVLWYVQMKG